MENIDKHYIELINKEIDHIITPAEKTKLHNYLSDNKTAKEYYDALIMTNNYVDSLPDQEPSENLKKQIINSIDFSRYSAKPQKQHFWNLLFRPKFRLAYAFAIGLFLGIIFYAILVDNSNTININDVYGTIGINKEAATVDELPLKFSDIAGKIDVKSVDKNFWFNLELNSVNKFDVFISYPEHVKFENIRLGQAKDIEISKGQNFIKTTNLGSQKYSLLFSQNDTETTILHIQIQQAGTVLYEHDISL